MASRSERERAERARIMAKARREGNRSLTDAERAALTPGQRQKLGIGVNQTGLDVPGDTNGGTDFSTVPQTPGAISADGNSIVPVGTPGSTVPTPNPGTPPPPKFAFNPQDEQYVNDLAARKRAFDTMLANITAGEDTAGSNFGFGFRRYTADQFNPQGVLIARAGDVDQTSFTTPTQFNERGLDPTNPFSRASLLNQSYVQAGRYGEGSYANRGLLTSGAYQRSMNRNAENRAKNFDSLQKEFASRLNDFRNQRNTGYTQYDTDKTNIFRDSFGRQRDTFLANNPS